ncbi:MAG: hypothetical protein C4560_03130 [Nitrospiraceae bacterium]|nr:MAG: hypothetical protein C4560_03130 [Nitrospiraceae bacterium]
MSCDVCRETLLIDKVEPPCFNEDGDEQRPGINSCWIPPPDERGQRILDIRAKITSLQGLVDPGTILGLYNADLEDIELLAWLEEQIKEMNGKQNG